jgi:hypothetical protein
MIYKNTKISTNGSDSLAVKKQGMQGGILSPIHFNMYINDLAKCIMQIAPDIYYYADDLACIALKLIRILINSNLQLLIYIWTVFIGSNLLYASMFYSNFISIKHVILNLIGFTQRP